MEKKEEPEPAVAEVIPPAPAITTKLPDELESKRIKVKFNDQTFYLNVSRFTEANGRTRAVEAFISTDSLAETELATAVAKLLSHILRFDADPLGALAKLKTVSGPDVAWVGGRMYRGLVSLIAHQLEAYILSLDNQGCGSECTCHQHASAAGGVPSETTKVQVIPGATLCPDCQQYGVKRESGCSHCVLCGSGKCN